MMRMLITAFALVGCLLVTVAAQNVEAPTRISFERGSSFASTARGLAVTVTSGRNGISPPSLTISAWDDACVFRVSLIDEPLAGPDMEGTVERQSNDSVTVILPNAHHDLFCRSDGSFEWSITLHAKPPSNTLSFSLTHRGVACFYQDTLTKYEREVMHAERPDSVVGSYAVYRLVSSDAGSPTIADKVMHIYRPRAFCGDDTVWCDLTVADSSLSITVPQAFLETADYERGVTIDPTFGHSGEPASEANMPDDAVAYVSASLVAGSGYTVTELSSHTKVYNGTVTHDMGIYSMPSGSLDGGSLTGGTHQLAIGNTGTRQWNTLSGLAISLSAGTEYCVAIGNPSGTVRLGYDLGESGEYHASHSGSVTLPSTWSENLGTRYIYGIRATYTSESGSNPISRRRAVLLKQ